MSELSVLSQDVTKTNTDRSNYSVEFTQLQNYISDIGKKSFNGVTLFATSGEAVTIDSDASKFTMNAIDMTLDHVDNRFGWDLQREHIGDHHHDQCCLGVEHIQTSIQTQDMRAKVGANIQRLNLTDQAVNILNENLSAANSRIKDVDVANESMVYARANILVQSGTAMLTQANVLPCSRHYV